ncbi:MAG: hypothetical protein LC121_23565 [Anaerolineae bacterium]|nr:hypothetical protein [Anaerolineae bacterium]
MTLDEITQQAIEPAYALLPAAMRSKEATLMLLAIGLQESRFEHRRQIGGPARGFWQFERGGGVLGILTHPASRQAARDVCTRYDIGWDSREVYRELVDNDVLAAAFARLLLWTDPAPLPALGDEAGAWAYYLRNWRPGKPHPQTWPEMYQNALSFVLRA